MVSSVNGKLKGDAWVVPEGGLAMVYVTNLMHKLEIIAELRAAFTEAEGIEKIYCVEDFAMLGLPVPKDNDQAPDLLLAAKPGYFFSSDLGKNFVSNVIGGTHGFLSSDPQMQAIFLAWGEGISRGIQLSNITNRDVAPTIARLLGLELPSAQGHAIPGIK